MGTFYLRYGTLSGKFVQNLNDSGFFKGDRPFAGNQILKNSRLSWTVI